MSIDPKQALALALVCALSALGVACGNDEDDVSVKEGEAVKLGDLLYNVQITRFLNPDDAEDASYLEGKPDAPPEKAYLAVFMTVSNEGDDPVSVAGDFEIEDTRGDTYPSVRSDSPYALDPGTELGGGDELPEPGTAAASGPIQGAMVLFLIDESATENRPLELKIPSPSGDGRVELDI
jgi:hypothetical protein